ncbi:MAG: SDR family oxidoreductase [Hyphomicrobiales bacterium]|nr:SDR family oxidoreductase [Hyphomicrobiales bacterium]
MDLAITGKTALITGASLGIGKATAQELVRAGCNVALIARNPQRLEAFAASLRNPGGPQVVAVSADLYEAADLTRAIADARKALGPIDILINNAGATPAGGLTDLPDSVWQKSFDLKLMGYVRCARELLPEMCERRWGRIVNVVGLGAYQANPRYLTGGAINAACLAVTKSLAKEAAPHQVSVNAVNPGPVDTPRWRDLLVQRAEKSGRTIEEEEKISVGGVPMGRPALPEEVASLIAYLCSQQAGYISGALVNIDGASSNGF